jgi:2-oxoacid:acceptor oxidoreductase alpha subunit
MEKHSVEATQEEKLKKRKRPVGSTAFRRSKTRFVWLNVLPGDLWLKVREGENVWEALQNEDVDLDGECGGLGKCGKCKIKVLSSLGPPTPAEEQLLDEDELKQGIRLACRTSMDQILKTGHRPLLHPQPLIEKRLITLPPELQDEGFSDLDQIKTVMVTEYQDLKAPLYCLRTLPERLKDTEFSGTAVIHGNDLLAWQDQEEVDCYYGLVFDLGTSTLVGKLISLIDGSEVAVVSSLNSQMRYGSNVISRLQYIRDHTYGLENFHTLLVRDLNRITKRLLKAAELEPDDIFIAVAAGNTTMQHLLLRLDPSGISEAPFSPVLTDGLVVKTNDLGLELHPESLLYVMPTRSGYIGGDLISVILASGASEQEDEMVLGLDLGTNGEIFLGNKNRLMTCSAAAGPALEGATISYGMIAKAGAIEGAYLEDGDLLYQIIGNIKPKGLCGSGMVDLAAVLLHTGIIVKRAGVYDFLVASAEESHNTRPIYLTQKDVRELQLAKGAIAAGISILADEMGIGIDEINSVYLAGALGNYVEPLSAMRVGLIPKFDPGIVRSLGNAASTGASMVLLSKDYWRTANELSDFIEHIEMSSRLDFDQYFVRRAHGLPQGEFVVAREAKDRLTIGIVGAGGDGVVVLGSLLQRLTALQGYFSQMPRYYGAQIRGGGSAIKLGIDSQRLSMPNDTLDVLLCFSWEKYSEFSIELETGLDTLVICENQPDKDVLSSENIFQVTFAKISREVSGTTQNKNLIAMGLLSRILGLPEERMKKDIERDKELGLLRRNTAAIEAGARLFAEQSLPQCTLTPAQDTSLKIIIHGNDAIAKGAIAADCNAFFGYPITPAAEVMQEMQKQLLKRNGTFLQAEDEISAAGFMIGASLTGTKAMTSTSGPGLDLMTEMMGLASAAEIPMVISNIQRCGPSTGIPSKSEQSDLNHAIYGGHGEAPRVVLTPFDVESCYRLSIESFNIAQYFQTPVILLSDQWLGQTFVSINNTFIEKDIHIDGIRKPGIDKLKDYRRYHITDDFISPMASLGDERLTYQTSGLTHGEKGSPSFNFETHQTSHEKRWKKLLPLVRRDDLTEIIGPEDCTGGIISWGSSAQAVFETVGALGLQREVQVCVPLLMHPLPEKVVKFIESLNKLLVVEMNYSGQLYRYLRSCIDLPENTQLYSRAGGRPFSIKELSPSIMEIAR